jgi:glutaredoxin
MFDSIKLTLYTQTNCVFCEIMKAKLNDWGFTYQVVNIKENKNALMFIKNEGHKTVPQLYWNKVHLNKVNTDEFTQLHLEEALDLDNYTGGVEYFGK